MFLYFCLVVWGINIVLLKCSCCIPISRFILWNSCIHFFASLLFIVVCTFFLLQDDTRLIRNCISGHIYDSSPVDFTSDIGARFSLHPTILKMPGAAKIISSIAKGVASGLDALFITKFGSDRTEYWQTLYSSVVSSY